MSTYFTIAAIITVAYLIYYTVIVMNDLYGKKNTQQSSIEEIEVPSGTESSGTEPSGTEELDEQPVMVVESDNGFQVADLHYETDTINDESEPLEDETTDTPTDDTEPEKKDVAEDITQKAMERGDPIKPAFSHPYLKKELTQQVVNQATGKHNDTIGKPKINIESIEDIRV